LGAFLKSLVKVYGKHVVYSDGGTWYPESEVMEAETPNPLVKIEYKGRQSNVMIGPTIRI
jgi:hypothetical protein